MSDQFDIRKVRIDYSPNVGSDSDPEDGYYMTMHRIEAMYNGGEIGALDFNQVSQLDENGNEEDILYLAYIKVESEYRGTGISGMLYKKFGEVYSQNFMDWEVERHFESPIAEYSFKKAVDQGWVPNQAYTPERTTRSYDDKKEQQWNDLKQKLPENLHASRFSRLKKIAISDDEKIDLRQGIQFEVSGPSEEKDWGQTLRSSYEISAMYAGSQIGYLDFSKYVPKEEAKDYTEPELYVSFLYVQQYFEGAGVGQMLYKKFGEMYTEQFNGWAVGRQFVNPVAEYSFRKAVSLGWVPDMALSEEKIIRDYSTKNKALWNDLRQKLPEHVRGPEASMKKDLRKLASDLSVTDIRSGIILEDGGSIGSSTYDNGLTMDTHMVYAQLNGEEVGSIRFTAYVYDTNSAYAGRDKVHIDLIKVTEQYQSLGIGQLLLQKFGEIYQQQFDRLPVSVDFHNPIAEYSYRKAISLGWISGWALNDDKLKRNYDKKDKTLWKDLRKKLPPMYRGSSRLKKLFKLADLSEIDMRNIVLSYTESEEDGDYVGAEKQVDYSINAKLSNGINIGNMYFSAFYNVENPKYIHENNRSLRDLPPGSNIIHVDEVQVKEEYRSYGVGQLLYKKFGEIYNSNFSDWPVSRYYINPIAEYAFRKAVSLGWINETSIDDKYVKRDRYNKSLKTNPDEVWNDLRNKLPEQYKGPEYWAKGNDYRLRKFASEVAVGPIDVQKKEINNRGRKIEIFRDGEMLGDMKYEIYPEHEYIYINYVEVQEQYRKNGVAMLLYKTFSEEYNSQYQNWRLGRTFINPVAEYTFNKAVAMGWFPEITLNNTKRDYNHQDEEKWYNELLPKLTDFRQKNKSVV
ncbi:MAG: hypothetical protein K0R18_436 [Bacillales bacterium]|jgi:GNAT superfamily N-acetyltransferase|nr:hypothetical protein [Bacillales bacterium]